jgi:hypothetical protein
VRPSWECDGFGVAWVVPRFVRFQETGTLRRGRGLANAWETEGLPKRRRSRRTPKSHPSENAAQTGQFALPPPRLKWLWELGILFVLFALLLALGAPRAVAQLSKSAEVERDRAYARQQFQKNFKDLQVVSQGLLREHEASRLTPARLQKDVRAIQRSAKTLRSMQALGDLAKPTEINKEIDTPVEFDEAIRKLHQLIYDYAHNPTHQSNKVFNTDQAERAQTELLAIINLAKALEGKSKGYTAATRASSN